MKGDYGSGPTKPAQLSGKFGRWGKKTPRSSTMGFSVGVRRPISLFGGGFTPWPRRGTQTRRTDALLLFHFGFGGKESQDLKKTGHGPVVGKMHFEAKGLCFSLPTHFQLFAYTEGPKS